jgi:heme/copper-type cytochrome/quinol oxidase subunit 1
MTTLLVIHGVLVLFAMKRGWRVGPFVLLVIPPLLAKLEPHFPEMALAGWVLPFTNLLVLVAGFCTCSLIYTSIADPEPA